MHLLLLPKWNAKKYSNKTEEKKNSQRIKQNKTDSDDHWKVFLLKKVFHFGWFKIYVEFVLFHSSDDIYIEWMKFLLMMSNSLDNHVDVLNNMHSIWGENQFDRMGYTDDKRRWCTFEWLHDFLELINLMSHDLIESKTLTHLVMRRTNDKSKRIKNITK